MLPGMERALGSADGPAFIGSAVGSEVWQERISVRSAGRRTVCSRCGSKAQDERWGELAGGRAKGAFPPAKGAGRLKPRGFLRPARELFH